MGINDYLNLIPSQHRQKPRYMATLEALIRPLCAMEDLLNEMRTAFDLDSAVGRQLDAVGERVGRSRYLHTPLKVYFGWNTDHVGWNEGAWKDKYDPETGLYALPDDVYRLLLKAKVAANHWDGTVPGAYAAWEIAFADPGGTASASGIIVIQDNQDMSMVIGLAGMPVSPVFEQLLVQQYIPLKPEGVRVSWYAVTPDGGPLFAWNCDSKALAGWPDKSVDNSAWGGRWPKVLKPINQAGGA